MLAEADFFTTALSLAMVEHQDEHPPTAQPATPASIESRHTAKSSKELLLHRGSADLRFVEVAVGLGKLSLRPLGPFSALRSTKLSSDDCKGDESQSIDGDKDDVDSQDDVGSKDGIDSVDGTVGKVVGIERSLESKDDAENNNDVGGKDVAEATNCAESEDHTEIKDDTGTDNGETKAKHRSSPEPQFHGGEPQPEATAGEPTMHHSFTKGDVVLVSSDNVGFAFSLDVLALHSPVFLDLVDLPRSADCSNQIPMSNACAATLEVILGHLDGRDPAPVLSVAVLDELVDFLDAFELPVWVIVKAVFRSDLNVGIKYAFARIYRPFWELKWEYECLDTKDLELCQPWARYPEAHQRLLDLFVKWQAAHEKYIAMFVGNMMDRNDSFGNVCCTPPCKTFRTYHGDWKKLKGEVAECLAALVMDSPKTGKGDISDHCQGMIACWTCAYRMGAHGVFTWKKLVKNRSWRA